MDKRVEYYGLPATERPKILVTKQLDLSGEKGRRIVYAETKKILKTHQNTFRKLANM